MQTITNKDIYLLERARQGFDLAPTYLYQG